MRKFFLVLGLVLIGILIAAYVAWVNKENIAAHFLSRQLHVPVTIRALNISKKEADISRLWIGNPPHSKTSTSFSAETISIYSNLDQVLGDPLIIDEIDISNIYVGVEYYEGDETNWTYILENSNETKEVNRDYLIRTLILENLTVEVMQADGKIIRYPTIQRMEFHNISSETGFPIEEIEKAIFNMMMQDLFKRVLKQFPSNLPGLGPLKYLPGFK